MKREIKGKGEEEEKGEVQLERIKDEKEHLWWCDPLNRFWPYYKGFSCTKKERKKERKKKAMSPPLSLDHRSGSRIAHLSGRQVGRR